MLSLALTSMRGMPRSEHGFTLIEMLVAMVLAAVVLTGVMTTLEVTMDQSPDARARSWLGSRTSSIRPA